MTELKSSNLSVNEKLSRHLPNQVQQLDLKLLWYIEFRSKSLKQLMWRNPSPATWVWMRNCQKICQTKSRNLIWNCFDIWNSGRKAENRGKMTKPKSINLSVNEKLSRNFPNQVQLIDLKLLLYMKFRSKSQKQSWNDGTQVKQLDCAWEIVKKFTKPSQATWIEIALINGIHIEKPKTELKWRNPSPATWVCMRNCQEIYQTKSSNLNWNCFKEWNSYRKAENRVEMTEPKSSNLSVYEKLSRKLPNQVQQLDLKLFWYLEFRSKSQNRIEETELKSSNLIVNKELSSNLPNQVQQLDLNWFDMWNSSRNAKNRVEMTEPKSSNLSVNEKLSRKLPKQVQQIEFKLL